MRYFGSCIGHRGLRSTTTASFDDDVVDAEWQDTALDNELDSDSDSQEEGETETHAAPVSLEDVEDEVPLAARQLEDLLRLVPEISEAGVQNALEAELTAIEAAMEDEDDAEDALAELQEWELEDDDGRVDSVLGAAPDGLDDEFSLLGYAPL
ncbi:hypothetical protein C8T65DRAFT_745364 [Cerioporus squamosus]|nr:hypothetical protein C8T65DRAFT_745364 [Cerioporus squamosus]